jgi:hypothetical protein
MTFHTWLTASVVWIALVSGVALTSGPMSAHNAVGIDRRTGARVHTLLVAAGQHLRTVVVHGALGSAAGRVGIAQVAGRTHAARLVVLRLTDRLPSALLVQAGVLTRA